MNDASLIDAATFGELQETAGADFVKELLDAFQEEAPGMLAELRLALAQGDLLRFRRAAHSLKSNSQAFGATALAGLARQLELGSMPPDAASVSELESLYARTLAALQEAAHGSAL